MKDHRFAFVTEMPGNRVTREQLNMIACRYAWAADLVDGLDVLEVACGPGLGLGHLASRARCIIGGDLDADCVRMLTSHYRGRMAVSRFNAQDLPFASDRFDAVLMFEAIYYLQDMDLFITECRRVLRPGGMLLLTLPNRDWPGFNKSPHSRCYLSPAEWAELGQRHGFTVQVYGTYPQREVTLRQRVLGTIRKATMKLHLVPTGHARTEAIRRVLKRLVYGELEVLPHEVRPGMANGCGQMMLPLDRIDRLHRVFFVIAHRDPLGSVPNRSE